jgi:hypothetical protein
MADRRCKVDVEEKAYTTVKLPAEWKERERERETIQAFFWVQLQQPLQCENGREASRWCACLPVPQD